MNHPLLLPRVHINRKWEAESELTPGIRTDGRGMQVFPSDLFSAKHLGLARIFVQPVSSIPKGRRGDLLLFFDK